MRWLLFMCVLGFAVVPTLASAEDEQVKPDRRDPLGETILSEAEAVRYLYDVTRAEIETGAVTLREGAIRDMPGNQARWEEIRQAALKAEYGPALKLARSARGPMMTVLRDVFRDKPSSAAIDALKAYALAVKPRVAAMDNQVSNYELTDKARASYFMGKAMFKDGFKSIKRKRWDQGFREIVAALSEYDVVIYECYPPSR